MTVKIHKALADLGFCSRRKAEELVAEQRVTVNGAVATVGQRVELGTDVLAVDGKVLSTPEEHQYWLVYKPVGIVSTTSDELGRPTVLSLVPTAATERTRLYPVGRLDVDSQGLMLLTNDGALTQLLTHPSTQITKVYRVTILGVPTGKALEHLRSGVRLKEGFTAPADVIIVREERETTTLDISIHEGRNRQVRRMLRRVGYEDVQQLERRQLGPFTLAQLHGQTYKQLSKEDVRKLLDAHKDQSKIRG